MAVTNYNGQLRSNEIFTAIFNVILSQYVFADNISSAGTQLVDMARVEGGLYGDTALWYATKELYSTEWGNKAEAANLLELHYPESPKCQAIVLDTFRQISLTVDNYLSKRAWADEGTFSSFNSVMLSWIRETKRIYDATTYNAFVGTDETDIGKQKQTITLPTVADDAEAQARLRGQAIAKGVADLLVDLKDITYDYNDYGFLRSYDPSDLIFVWNAQAVNTITKMDVPTIFNKDGLIDKLGQYTLPARYFGKVNTSGGTTGPDNKTIRSLVEKVYGSKHVFAGELLPNDTAYDANETYTEDPTILFKVMHKRSVPYMSAFEAATSFFNAKSLTENHYLTWGHNTLEHLFNYPMITVRAEEA